MLQDFLIPSGTVESVQRNVECVQKIRNGNLEKLLNIGKHIIHRYVMKKSVLSSKMNATENIFSDNFISGMEGFEQCNENTLRRNPLILSITIFIYIISNCIYEMQVFLPINPLTILANSILF